VSSKTEGASSEISRRQPGSSTAKPAAQYVISQNSASFTKPVFTERAFHPDQLDLRVKAEHRNRAARRICGDRQHAIQALPQCVRQSAETVEAARTDVGGGRLHRVLPEVPRELDPPAHVDPCPPATLVCNGQFETAPIWKRDMLDKEFLPLIRSAYPTIRY